MRLCVERLVPLRKGRPVVFDLPPVKTAADVAGAVGELSRAMAAGELTTDEASAAASVIEMHRRAIEYRQGRRRDGLQRQPRSHQPRLLIADRSPIDSAPPH